MEGPVKELTEASTSDAHLHVYMCKDQAMSGVVGIAWVGTLCKWKGYQASVNEKRYDVVGTAEV